MLPTAEIEITHWAPRNLSPQMLARKLSSLGVTRWPGPAREHGLDEIAGEPDQPAGRTIHGLEYERFLDVPDQPASEPVALLAADVAKDTASMRDRARAEVPRSRRGLGARAGRVREDVQVGERQLADEGDGLGEVGVGLTREADDEVGPEAEPRPRGGQTLDERPVHPRVVRTPHRLQHPVA